MLKRRQWTESRDRKETVKEARKRADWALKHDDGIVRRKDYSSVMLCSMRGNPMRINLSPGDEGFTRCNILQITSHHSDLHADINPNLHKTASVLGLSLSFSCSPLETFSVLTFCFLELQLRQY